MCSTPCYRSRYCSTGMLWRGGFRWDPLPKVSLTTRPSTIKAPVLRVLRNHLSPVWSDIPPTYLPQRTSTPQAASILFFRPRECEMGWGRGKEGHGKPKSQPSLCWVLLKVEYPHRLPCVWLGAQRQAFKETHPALHPVLPLGSCGTPGKCLYLSEPFFTLKMGLL